MGKIKILDTYNYESYNPASETYPEGVFEVSDDILKQIGITKKFDVAKNKVTDMTEYEIASEKSKKAARLFAETEFINKSKRTRYLDAYRKYQAAVNYGEFEKSIEVDEFMEKLRDKDWSAYDNIPSQLKYFTGEVGFEDSGLVAHHEI